MLPPVKAIRSTKRVFDQRFAGLGAEAGNDVDHALGKPAC